MCEEGIGRLNRSRSMEEIESRRESDLPVLLLKLDIRSFAAPPAL